MFLIFFSLLFPLQVFPLSLSSLMSCRYKASLRLSLNRALYRVLLGRKREFSMHSMHRKLPFSASFPVLDMIDLELDWAAISPTRLCSHSSWCGWYALPIQRLHYCDSVQAWQICHWELYLLSRRDDFLFSIEPFDIFIVLVEVESQDANLKVPSVVIWLLLILMC